MARATPTLPKPAARATAAATALMRDRSSAVTSTLPAWMPARPSPSITADTSTPILFSANTPEPATPMPTAPAPTAAVPATTMATMSCAARACTLSASAPSTSVSTRPALTASGVSLPAPGRQPMKFCDTAMPMDAPMPTAPPPTASAAATTTELMPALLLALMAMSSALSSTLPLTRAEVPPRMTFCATAPAPATAMPTLPKPTASEAAAATALMVLWVTASWPLAVRVRISVRPSGATTDQRWPSSSTLTRSGFTRCQRPVSA